jgi:hypothetical protein
LGGSKTQISTFYYFAHFLIVLSIISYLEKALKLNLGVKIVPTPSFAFHPEVVANNKTRRPRRLRKNPFSGFFRKQTSRVI